MWTDALSASKAALATYPNAETITFTTAGAVLSPELHTSLVDAVNYEKILAVQPYSIKPGSDLESTEHNPRIITQIDADISTFKAKPLRDYLETMENTLGPDVTPTDFSIYLNQLGYSSISISSLLYKESPRTSISRNQPKREWDAYIAHVNNSWDATNKDPILFFSGLVNPGIKPSVLIDASTTPTRMNGTARSITSFLSVLEEKLSSKELDWNITVIIPADSRTALNISSDHLTWVEPTEELTKKYHLGISMTPVGTLEQCINMSTHCVRWQVLHLDIIALRGLQFLSQNTEASSAVQFYLEQADSVIFISEFARTDVVNYFGNIEGLLERSSVIHLGTHFATGILSAPIVQESPVLVLGNDYPHKQIQPVVNALHRNGISVMTLTHQFLTGQVSPEPHAGPISDENLQKIMASAPVIVFPSMNEGYGLPIAEAAALKKPLVLWDTEVSREVSRRLGVEETNTFCSSIEELVSAVSMQLASPQAAKAPSEIRSLREFNDEFLTTSSDLLSKPVNISRLKEKWKLINLLSEVAASAERRVTQQISAQHWRTRLAKKFK
jgi:glycosyltransferase involved in cell wall biosynthesis